MVNLYAPVTIMSFALLKKKKKHVVRVNVSSCNPVTKYAGYFFFYFVKTFLTFQFRYLAYREITGNKKLIWPKFLLHLAHV